MVTIRLGVVICAGTLLLSACGGGSAANAPGVLVPPALHAARPPAEKRYPKGLLALYRFDGTLDDSSGNGYTAKDTGKPEYVDGAPFGGKAIKFDGSGNAIVHAPLNISVNKIPQLTMGGWFKASSLKNPAYGIVSNDDGDFDRTLDIDDRDPKPGVHWSAFVGSTVVGTVFAHTGKWVFMAVSYDQKTLPGNYAFYTNTGNKTTTLTGPDNFDQDSVTKYVAIGRNPNYDQPFDGQVTKVFFYVGILTKKQIGEIIAHGPSRIP